MRDEDKTKEQLIRELKELRQRASGPSLSNRKSRCSNDLNIEMNAHHDALIYTVPDIVYFKDIQGRNLVVNKAFDAIFISDPQTGRFWDVNDKACSNLGYSRDKLLNMGVSDIETILPDNFSWQAHVREVKERGFMILEGRHKRRDGTTFPVEVSLKYITQDKNDYMVAVARDITERKRMEGKYSAIIHASMDGFWTIDTEGRILDVNNAVCKLLGYRREELLTMKIHDIDAMETPEETALHIKHAKETGYYRFETKHRLKKGGLIDVEVCCNYLIDSGLFFAFSRDITDRKRAEERKMSDQKRLMQELIDILPGTSHLIDEHGYIERWNKCFEEVSGYSYEEIKEMNVLDFIPEDEKAYVKKRMKEVFTNGRATVEVNLLSKDGGKTPYFGTGIRTTINNKPYAIGVGIDISEQKRLEQEILKAQKLDSIDVLAGGIAHDFNNILTAIIGYISLSKESLNPDSDVYKRLSEAEKASFRAQELTRQLLTFSLKAGHL